MPAARRPYTQAEDAYMRKHYPHIQAAEIARTLGRTLSSVYQAAQRLGLRKSAAFMASDRAGRIRRGRPEQYMRRQFLGAPPSGKTGDNHPWRQQTRQDLARSNATTRQDTP